MGDITDYKRAANKLQKIEGIDLVIALVPDGMEEDGPYNPFKTIWAKANIPVTDDQYENSKIVR